VAFLRGHSGSDTGQLVAVSQEPGGAVSCFSGAWGYSHLVLEGAGVQECVFYIFYPTHRPRGQGVMNTKPCYHGDMSHPGPVGWIKNVEYIFYQN
jgi:hypothetical protein